jgi:hypothetical protein
MNKINNIDIIILAIYLMKSGSIYTDTEDIAIKVNDIAPGRFAWKKYKDQINIENVRKRLSDAMKIEYGGYVTGSTKKGWLLTEAGLKFAKQKIKDLNSIELLGKPTSNKESLWQNRERVRMLGTIAFEKISAINAEAVTVQEAEAFFMVDDYVTGKARERKLNRILETFGDDLELGKVVKFLAGKVRIK